MNVTIQLIIDFIKEYIDNFTKLYELCKYNILLLLSIPDDANNKDLLLKELFKVNLSYTSVGRYRFSGNSQNKYEIKQIEYRDKLNYYCILLKYCQIALDHIHKRFKISIIEFNEKHYNDYNDCENSIINFFNDKLNITSTTGRISKIFSFATKAQLNPYSILNDKQIKNLSQILKNIYGSISSIHSVNKGGLK